MLVVHSVLAMLVVGCSSSLDNQAGGVSVIVEENQVFPGDAAGRWKADEQGWEFVLAPDGRILSAVIGLGRVRVAPGRVTTVPTKSGGEGVFAPGPWTVHYVPSTKQLTIRITMDRVCVEMAGNSVEGTSTDVFAGPIDPARGVWQAQWTTFTRYTVRTPEKPSIDLSTDPTYGETRPLTFRRTADQ
jgi:hypothetical protein